MLDVVRILYGTNAVVYHSLLSFVSYYLCRLNLLLVSSTLVSPTLPAMKTMIVGFLRFFTILL